MKITYGMVESVLGWYAQLESRGSVVHNLEVATRLKIIRNMRKLRPIQEAYVEAKDRLIMQYSGGTGVLKATDPGYAGYVKAERDLRLAEPPELELEVIYQAELDLESNKIDPLALTGLGDLIKLD
jgi:hypothetical protein